MKRKIAAVVASVALLSGLATMPVAFADTGGGPGSNSGCPGHQPPPPPNHNCGK